MSLVEELELLAATISGEFNSVREEMSELPGGSTSGMVDGGRPDTIFGGTTSIDGGVP